MSSLSGWGDRILPDQIFIFLPLTLESTLDCDLVSWIELLYYKGCYTILNEHAYSHKHLL